MTITVAEILGQVPVFSIRPLCGFGQGLFRVPFQDFNSTPQGIQADIDQTRPLCQRMRFSLIRQHYVSAFIVALLNNSRPSAIFRAVIAVIVSSIQCMCRCGAISHILQKALNAIHTIFSIYPTVTHAYASRAIMLILTISRHSATSYHSVINRTNRRIGKSVRSVIWNVAFSASTTFRCAIKQSSTCSSHNFSTLTLYNPTMTLIYPTRIAQHRPIFKFTVGQIVQSHCSIFALDKWNDFQRIFNHRFPLFDIIIPQGVDAT